MTITVEYNSPYFELSFPYNDDDLEIVRDLPIRVWSKKDKLWRVPRLAVKSIESLENSHWTPKALKAKKTVLDAILRLVDMKFEEGESDGKLRGYQVVGKEFLIASKKGLLADDMGLGKTIQAIAAAKELNPKKCLVLCPSSMKFKWADEFKKHYDIDAIVVGGSKEERKMVWESNAQFTIANYDLIIPRHDWSEMPHEWDIIIADEAVYLKNPKAQRTKQMFKLDSEYRFALSGIYIENKLEEFWSIMHWVRPEVVPTTLFQFQARYCDYDWAGNYVGPQQKTLPELLALASPYVLRREKTDKLKDLPPKIYSDVPLEMSAKEELAYAELSKKFKEWLKDKYTGGTKPINAFDGTLACREFVEFHELADEKWKSIQNSKLAYIKELYAEVDKIVIFSFFKRSVRKLAEIFETKYIIDGDVSASDRFETTKKFNSAKRGILVSTDAGKFGLDMVGADTLVHYGYVHNPGTMVQREDRLWRLGQTNVVNIIRPYLKDTIDEGIMHVYNHRLKQAKDFMEGAETVQSLKLSVNDYIRLVEGKNLYEEDYISDYDRD